MGTRKRCPVITPDRGSRNLQVDQIQKQAHHFYRVCVCVSTGKRGCMVWGFTQDKSGEVGLWNHWLWSSQSAVTWARLWKWWMWLWQDSDGKEAKVLQKRAETWRGKSMCSNTRDCLLHWRLVPHMRGEPERSWASAAQDQPNSQHAFSMRVSHTGKMWNKIQGKLR